MVRRAELSYHTEINQHNLNKIRKVFYNANSLYFFYTLTSPILIICEFYRKEIRPLRSQVKFQIGSVNYLYGEMLQRLHILILLIIFIIHFILWTSSNYNYYTWVFSHTLDNFNYQLICCNHKKINPRFSKSLGLEIPFG